MIKQKCEVELIRSTGEKIYAYVEGRVTEKPVQRLQLAVIDIIERKCRETSLMESDRSL